MPRTIHITAHALVMKHNHIQQLKNSSHILYDVLEASFNEFYKYNKQRLDDILARQLTLEKKYFLFKDGKIQMDVKTERFVLNEGRTREEFDIDYKSQMMKLVPYVYNSSLPDIPLPTELIIPDTNIVSPDENVPGA